MIINILSLIVFVFTIGTVDAKIKWIEIEIDSGEKIRAIYGIPDKEGKHPAVIYNHGTFVRKLGYTEASNRGYDVKNFVKALVKEGFVALAPIRKEGRLRLSPRKKPNIMGGPPREWNAAIKEGMAVTASVLRFLKQQPNVDSQRFAIVGFSEGGLITLWSVFGRTDLRAIVLMSPANIGKSPQFQFKVAAKRIDEIETPVFLTLGKSDIKKIIHNCKDIFIPKMNRLNKHIEYKVNYPGDHKWFHKVRSEYWKDVISFLNKYLMQ
jgi:dienelactone hydrolase